MIGNPQGVVASAVCSVSYRPQLGPCALALIDLQINNHY
jgi:hypothetical protein